MESGKRIRVAFSEAHGLALEYSRHPPEGVDYSFAGPIRLPRLLTSPIKDFLGTYAPPDVDLIEAVLSPIETSLPWVYTCGDFQTAASFGLLGLPLPLFLRMLYLRRLFLADNCKRIVFRSEAGRQTIQTYAGVTDPELLCKTTVVYPAVSVPTEAPIAPPAPGRSLVFSGDFFRKGGANVIDAFEQLQASHRDLRLTLCCAPGDFRTGDERLKKHYLDRIAANPGIEVRGRLSRTEFVSDVLARADVFLMPTYVEAFGFAILEAMAHGVPVVSTNYFAIPEMIEHGVDGLLIDTSRFNCDRLFRGYVVNAIPDDFHRHVTSNLIELLGRLLDEDATRQRISRAARDKVRAKYSFAARNARMREIYREGLGLSD